MLDWLRRLDLNLLFALNHHHTPLWDWLMWQFSGNLLWLPLYFFVLFVFIKSFHRQSIWIILLVILAIGTSDFSSVHLFKETIKRLRPCHNPFLMGQIVLVHNHCGGLYGFFSSHASNTFTLATIASLLVRKKYFTAMMFLWAIIVSISRVYMGVHYPSDIMAGACWGMIIGLLFYVLTKYLILNHNGKSENR